jgi:tetratricopeptide (TPR) repeat protein
VRLSDGKYPDMHFHLGAAYFEVENWQFARQSFEKAAELDPKDDAAPYNVALCLQRLGFSLDAARWYEEVLKRNPARTDRQQLLNLIALLRR